MKTKYKKNNQILELLILITMSIKHLIILFIIIDLEFNPLLRNVVKWSATHLKSCSKCLKIFKVCLTILRHCEVKGYLVLYEIHYKVFHTITFVAVLASIMHQESNDSILNYGAFPFPDRY